MNKKHAREFVKQKLKESYEQHEVLNKNLSENLSQYLSQLNSDLGRRPTLGVYSPIEYEPVWWKSFSKNLVSELYLVHMHEEIKISYHHVNYDDLTNKKFGLVLEEKFLKESFTPDAILIPGLAYSKGMERLGRGKGYFDSFLKDYQGVKIGIFFSLQELNGFECEAHDEPLDVIITDREIIRGK